jgi:hypothetical protein
MPLKHELDCIKIKELCNDRITKLFWFRKVPKMKESRLLLGMYS